MKPEKYIHKCIKNAFLARLVKIYVVKKKSKCLKMSKNGQKNAFLARLIKIYVVKKKSKSSQKTDFSPVFLAFFGVNGEKVLLHSYVLKVS